MNNSLEVIGINSMMIHAIHTRFNLPIEVVQQLNEHFLIKWTGSHLQAQVDYRNGLQVHPRLWKNSKWYDVIFMQTRQDLFNQDEVWLSFRCLKLTSSNHSQHESPINVVLVRSYR